MIALLLALAAVDPAPQPQRPPPPALSKEDAELVKELALLEKLELVRNLDLFEEPKEEEPPPPPEKR